MFILLILPRSVKPYKMSNCVGGGRNADSCTAIKTKPRSTSNWNCHVINHHCIVNIRISAYDMLYIVIFLLQSCALCLRWRSEVQEERGGRPQVRQEEEGLGLDSRLKLSRRVRRPNRNCSLKPLQWCQIWLLPEWGDWSSWLDVTKPLQEEEWDQATRLSLEGRLVVWWSPSTWYLHLVPCTWYPVPGTLYPVPCASTWSPSTWPHPRGCRTIAVAYLSVSIAAQQGWVQQIKGGRAVSGPRILSFQSQKKPKKTNS